MEEPLGEQGRWDALPIRDNIYTTLEGVSSSGDLSMEDCKPEISPLSRAITHEDHTVYVQISRWDSNSWSLEVIDAYGNLTGWLELFESDQKAVDEFYRALLEEGIRSMVDGDCSCGSSSSTLPEPQ